MEKPLKLFEEFAEGRRPYLFPVRNIRTVPGAAKSGGLLHSVSLFLFNSYSYSTQYEIGNKTDGMTRILKTGKKKEDEEI